MVAPQTACAGQDGTYGDVDFTDIAVGLYRYCDADLGGRDEVLLDYGVDEVACYGGVGR